MDGVLKRRLDEENYDERNWDWEKLGGTFELGFWERSCLTLIYVNYRDELSY
jgi:hypothetical protein